MSLLRLSSHTYSKLVKSQNVPFNTSGVVHLDRFKAARIPLGVFGQGERYLLLSYIANNVSVSEYFYFWYQEFGVSDLSQYN